MPTLNLRENPQIRRNQPLQFMVADSCSIRRQQVEPGTAREEPFSERLPLERPFSQKACLSNVPFHS